MVSIYCEGCKGSFSGLRRHLSGSSDYRLESEGCIKIKLIANVEGTPRGYTHRRYPLGDPSKSTVTVPDRDPLRDTLGLIRTVYPRNPKTYLRITKGYYLIILLLRLPPKSTSSYPQRD